MEETKRLGYYRNNYLEIINSIPGVVNAYQEAKCDELLYDMKTKTKSLNKLLSMVNENTDVYLLDLTHLGCRLTTFIKSFKQLLESNCGIHIIKEFSFDKKSYPDMLNMLEVMECYDRAGKSVSDSVRKKRFKVLEAFELGMDPYDIGKQHNVSRRTIYQWIWWAKNERKKSNNKADEND